MLWLSGCKGMFGTGTYNHRFKPLFSSLPFSPEIFVGLRMCGKSLNVAVKPWRGRWPGTLRRREASSTRWRRRATLCSMHAKPFGLRPWTTFWRWVRYTVCAEKQSHAAWLYYCLQSARYAWIKYALSDYAVNDRRPAFGLLSGPVVVVGAEVASEFPGHGNVTTASFCFRLMSSRPRRRPKFWRQWVHLDQFRWNPYMCLYCTGCCFYWIYLGCLLYASCQMLSLMEAQAQFFQQGHQSLSELDEYRKKLNEEVTILFIFTRLICSFPPLHMSKPSLRSNSGYIGRRMLDVELPSEKSRAKLRMEFGGNRWFTVATPDGKSRK